MQCMLGYTPLPSACWDKPHLGQTHHLGRHPPPTATAADGTHPTEIHSCYCNISTLEFPMVCYQHLNPDGGRIKCLIFTVASQYCNGNVGGILIWIEPVDKGCNLDVMHSAVKSSAQFVIYSNNHSDRVAYSGLGIEPGTLGLILWQILFYNLLPSSLS